MTKPATTLARRLAEMVGELYARGHQLLDFHPHVAGAGFYRYILTVEAHPQFPRGDDPRDHLTVWDSLGGDGQLPWTNDANATPAALADAFLAHYPRIARLSRGDRPDRAAWFADMLRGTAPNGVLVHWYDECDSREPGFAAVIDASRVEKWPLPSDYRAPFEPDSKR